MSKEKDLKLDGDKAVEPKSSKKSLIILIVGIVLILVIAISATVIFMLPDDEATEETTVETSDVVAKEVTSPAQYLKLKPEFIINFQVGSRQRFLQIFMEIMARDPEVIAAVTQHGPLIRNNIIAFIGGQEFTALRTPEGRAKLREDLKLLINDVLVQEIGSGVIEEVLFTNFVMQ
jgi:flagellar FliL protein